MGKPLLSGRLMDKQQFTEAMKYALNKRNYACQTVKEIYEQKLEMSKTKQSGFFVEVGKLVGLTPKQAKDYYNNTWTQQLFSDIKPYRQQIKFIVIKNIIYNVQTLCDIVRDRFPNLVIQNRTLMQMIHVILRELKKQEKYSTINTPKRVLRKPTFGENTEMVSYESVSQEQEGVQQYNFIISNISDDFLELD